MFFFSSRRRHTRWPRDWSSDVCSSDLDAGMLSYANCVALEQAGYQFIIASRVGKMPKGLQAHLDTLDKHQMTNGWTTSIQEQLRADARSEERRVGKGGRARVWEVEGQEKRERRD